MSRHTWYCTLLWIFSFVMRSASLSMPKIFSDNMVLQCTDDGGKGASLWGFSTPGETINVFIGATQTTAYADGQGHWKANINMKASKKAYMVNVTDGKDVFSFKNVLFGDVWLCSGQSNMVFAVQTMYNGTLYENETIKYPEIRLFQVPGNQEATPQSDLKGGSWRENSPSNVKTFSAVCYASAVWFKKERSDLRDRPFGLIQSCVGGTPVEAWMPTSALDSCGIIPSNSSSVTCGRTNNSVLFNGMIYPLAPFSLRGSMWYQGEANVGCQKSKSPAAVYSCDFAAMITSWRKLWGAEFTFLFVQLAAYGNPDLTSALRSSDELPELRLNQTAVLKLPKVGMALAIDRGDKGSCKPSKYLEELNLTYPGGIHPCNKTAVARRMALALNHIDGVKGPYQGPVVTKISKNTEGSVTITFDVDSAKGMAYVNTEACTSCCEKDTPFEVLYKNGTYMLVPLTNAKITGSVVTLSNVDSDVIGVRYSHQGFPQCVLTNMYDLPAPPFRQMI